MHMVEQMSANISHLSSGLKDTITSGHHFRSDKQITRLYNRHGHTNTHTYTDTHTQTHTQCPISQGRGQTSQLILLTILLLGLGPLLGVGLSPQTHYPRTYAKRLLYTHK